MSISTVSGTTEVFEIGRVLSRTFGAIGRNVALFVGLSAILAGVPQLIAGLWQASAGAIDKVGAPAVMAIVFGALLGVLGTVVLQVAITRATVSDLVGERPRFAACLKSGITLFLPMIGLTIVAGLGVTLASLLLVVPGIMLFVAWSVAVPAYVQERVGISASLGRSRTLTKGARWKIFALLLVWWIIAVVLQVPATMLAAVAHAPSYVSVLLTAIVSTLTTMVLTTIQAAIYVELRDVKEGVAPNDLETIFA